MRRVSCSEGSTSRSGSGMGTWKTSTWCGRSRSSGMRWRVWIRVAARLSVVVATPVTRVTNLRMLTALTLSSAPWSMTLSTSSGPISASVSWRPPVPHPLAIGISREPKGTW